jgi:hypothetical protein
MQPKHYFEKDFHTHFFLRKTLLLSFFFKDERITICYKKAGVNDKFLG